MSKTAHIHGSAAARPSARGTPGPVRSATTRDWTTGPAKAVAVLVLGAASVVGICYAVLSSGHTGNNAVLSSAAGTATDDPRTNHDQGATVDHDGPEGEPAPAAAHPKPKSKSSAAGAAGVKLVNLNTATESELQLLPGIGPALAARIIADRQKSGAFKSVDDLDRIKGIGPRTIEKLRSLACVE